MNSADLRTRLGRLGLPPGAFGEVLSVLDPSRAKARHVREAYRLTSPTNMKPIPAAIRALVELLERVQPADWCTGSDVTENRLPRWLNALANSPSQAPQPERGPGR